MKTLFLSLLIFMSARCVAQLTVLPSAGSGSGATTVAGLSDAGTAAYSNATAFALSGSTNNLVSTNDTRSLNLSGVNLFTNLGNTLGGNGSAVTNLNGDNIASGTVAAARLPAGVVGQTNALNAVAFNGNGATVTNVPPGALNSTPPFTNAIIGYGDAQRTNAFAIGPGGIVSSNANGTFTVAAGLVASTAAGSNWIAGAVGIGGTNYATKIRVGGAAETPDALNVTGSARFSGELVGVNISLTNSTDTISRLFSGNTAKYSYLTLGRTTEDLEFGVAGASGQFFTGSVAGSGVLKQISGNLMIGVGAGLPNVIMGTANSAFTLPVLATNGIASFSTTASVAIDSTGWTNIWSTNNAFVYFGGTTVSSWKKRAGAGLTATNITFPVFTGNFTVALEPGQAVVISGTSVTGSADPF